MADFRTKLTEQVITEVRNFFKEKAFETIIPRSVRLGEAPSFGKPGVIYDRSSKGAKSYFELSCEFLKRFPPPQKKEKDNALENKLENVEQVTILSEEKTK